jgi:hypothetical protein
VFPVHLRALQPISGKVTDPACHGAAVAPFARTEYYKAIADCSERLDGQ